VQLQKTQSGAEQNAHIPHIKKMDMLRTLALAVDYLFIYLFI